MATIKVTIKGKAPILLHNPAGMARNGKGGKTAEIPTPEQEAEKSVYRDAEGNIGFPADNIKAAMIVAAPMYKVGKIRLSPFIAGSLSLSPAILTFGSNKYEIDTRRAVVQKAGVLRSRAKFSDWKFNFEIRVDEDFPVSDLKVIRDILEEAGRRVGIGDFRPQKKGWFGKFEVTKFDLGK